METSSPEQISERLICFGYKHFTFEYLEGKITLTSPLKGPRSYNADNWKTPDDLKVKELEAEPGFKKFNVRLGFDANFTVTIDLKTKIVETSKPMSSGFKFKVKAYPKQGTAVQFGEELKGWSSALIETTNGPLIGSAQRTEAGHTIYVAPSTVYYSDRDGKLVHHTSHYEDPKVLQARADRKRRDSNIEIVTLTASVATICALLLAQSPRMQADLADALDYVKVAVSQITDQ